MCNKVSTSNCLRTHGGFFKNNSISKTAKSYVHPVCILWDMVAVVWYDLITTPGRVARAIAQVEAWHESLMYKVASVLVARTLDCSILLRPVDVIYDEIYFLF